MIGIFKIFLCYLWLCMYFMNKIDKVFFTLRRKNFLRKRLIPVQEKAKIDSIKQQLRMYFI